MRPFFLLTKNIISSSNFSRTISSSSRCCICSSGGGAICLHGLHVYTVGSDIHAGREKGRGDLSRMTLPVVVAGHLRGAHLGVVEEGGGDEVHQWRVGRTVEVTTQHYGKQTTTSCKMKKSTWLHMYFLYNTRQRCTVHKAYVQCITRSELRSKDSTLCKASIQN